MATSKIFNKKLKENLEQIEFLQRIGHTNDFAYSNTSIDDINNNQTEIKIKSSTPATNSIKVVELFAGVGGFRVGLEKINLKNKTFNVVWSNQWEPSTKTQHASEIYCKRFGFVNHSNEDISTVEIEDIPEHDLMVGGFPCQDYSVATTLKNSAGILGKKGVLWWQIYRLLEQSKNKSPSYLMFENVDRLLKSPASQRGRDFALILSSLNSLGYATEWRVVDASAYGMPQRRKRVFIMGYKNGTKMYKIIKANSAESIINSIGIFGSTFPIQNIQNNHIISGNLSLDFVEITENFNKESSKSSPFMDTGFMINGIYHTAKTKPDYKGEQIVLKDILQNEDTVPEEFYISQEEIHKWEYHKGAKSYERTDKNTGHKYKYSEGGMGFPDSLDKPSRTIITGEGGGSPSRFKHVVYIDGKYRRLTPLELERLNMFPDNHTDGVSNTKRAFLMGNALVVGVIERLARTLISKI